MTLRYKNLYDYAYDIGYGLIDAVIYLKGEGMSREEARADQLQYMEDFGWEGQDEPPQEEPEDDFEADQYWDAVHQGLKDGLNAALDEVYRRK